MTEVAAGASTKGHLNDHSREYYSRHWPDGDVAQFETGLVRRSSAGRTNYKKRKGKICH